MLLYFRTTIIILITLFIIEIEAQNTEEAPFLYFYSYEESAFIIERADGSDREVLVNYTFPENSGVILDGVGYLGGDGWSTSGDWFVWTPFLRNGIPSQEAYMVNRFDKTIIDLANDYSITAYMSWSPNEDLLLLRQRGNYSDDLRERIGIYDPNLGSFIWEDNFFDTAGVNDFSWSVDGSKFIYHYGDLLTVYDTHTGEKVSLNSRVASWDCNFGGLPKWLDNSRIAYQNSDTTAIEVYNLETQTIENRVDIPNNDIRSTSWSPDNSDIIIFVETASDMFVYDVYMVSLFEETVSSIQNTVRGVHCSAESIYWLNNDSLVISTYEEGIGIWSALTDEISSLDIVDGNRVVGTSLVQAPNEELLFTWNVYDANEYHLYAYNFNTDTVRLVSSLMQGSNYLSPTFGNRVIFGRTMIDLDTGINTEILNFVEGIAHNLNDVQWSTNGDWVLGLSEAWEGISPVWIVSVNESHQSNITFCINSPSCFGWLPPVTN